MPEFDVAVVGAGNAAHCAALAAHEAGARVIILERAPEPESGGNSRFTAGAIRFPYRGVDDLREIMPDLSQEEIDRTDFGTYTEEQFFDDMFRVTRFRTDPTLCEPLVRNSFEAMKWLRSKGVRFQPIYGRQAFKVDGRFKFWGGLTVEAWGGGPGLIDSERSIAQSKGIVTRYGVRATSLITLEGKVAGLKLQEGGRERSISASAVVLACGGSNLTLKCVPPILAKLGIGKSAWDPLQHRRRDQDGKSDWRRSLWQLVRMPRCRLGLQRSRIRRPCSWRRISEAFLPLRHHGQCQWTALRR